VAAAADYFFSRPLLGGAAALLVNAFPFARTGSIRPSLAACARLADAGWSILLYPEGTRTPDGALGAFHPGAGLLAVELGLPVVPIYLDGLFQVLPKGRHIPRPGRVAVCFGPPLRFAPATPHGEAAAAIEAAVRALAGPVGQSVACPKGENHARYLWY
jgi:1-acyl-sn-glycerol-3-phosphate acyltransferase